MTDHASGRGLGRVPAPDDSHLVKYSLSPLTLPTNPESLVVGLDWTRAFDHPVEKTGPDGQVEYWAGLDPKHLGPVRGGHCVCLPYDPAADPQWAWSFFNQGDEGVCVGFGWSRRQAIANGCRYDGFSLFDWAVKHDDLPDTNTRQDGTTVRAGGEGLRLQGAWRSTARGKVSGPFLRDGIEEYVWARSVDDMNAVLRNPVYVQRGAAPFVNSWGKDFPHVTWVPFETWDRLLFHSGDGDCALATDRPGGGKAQKR